MVCEKTIRVGEKAEWFKGIGIRHIPCGKIAEQIEELKQKEFEAIVQGNQNAANEYAQKILEIQPSEKELFGLAESLYDNGDYDGAMMLYDKILKKIAIVNEGDLRSAINDLQSLSFGEINEKSLDSLGYREKEESIFNLLQLIFKSKDIDAINEYSNRVYLNLDEVLLWIEENLPIEYSSSELADSFEFLSRADIFRNRIIRRQHWRFLIYQKFLTNLGVALSKTSKKTIFNKYNKPQRILKIWKNKMKYSKKKQIAEKVSENCHLSFKKSMRHYLPYLKYISKNNKSS